MHAPGSYHSAIIVPHWRPRWQAQAAWYMLKDLGIFMHAKGTGTVQYKQEVIGHA